jgi:hypothetical protein
MKNYAPAPCAECPWRTDVPPGRFPPARFIALAKTAYDMALEQFACHKAPDSRAFGCAGFVLRGATHNLGARLSINAQRLDPRAVSSPFPLYCDYREMAVANGVEPDHPALAACRSP